MKNALIMLTEKLELQLQVKGKTSIDSSSALNKFRIFVELHIATRCHARYPLITNDSTQTHVALFFLLSTNFRMAISAPSVMSTSANTFQDTAYYEVLSPKYQE
jgi:hypothetical protein